VGVNKIVVATLEKSNQPHEGGEVTRAAAVQGLGQNGRVVADLGGKRTVRPGASKQLDSELLRIGRFGEGLGPGLDKGLTLRICEPEHAERRTRGEARGADARRWVLGRERRAKSAARHGDPARSQRSESLMH
jgi:hypothetical protein